MDRVGTRVLDTAVKPTRRVLFVTGEYPPRIGGIGDHVVRLAAALQAQEVVCYTATESRGVDEPAARIHAVGSRYPLQALWGVIRAARRVRPDVVHLHYQAGAFRRPGELAELPRLLRSLASESRLAVTFHDLRQPYLFPKAGPLRAWAVHRLMRSTQTAIYVDEIDRQQAVGLGYGNGRSYWIPAGPTIEPPAGLGDREAAREALGLNLEEFIVGFFGFRQPSKGINVLAGALRRPELSGPRTLLALIGAAAPPTSARRAEVSTPPNTFDGLRLVDTGAQAPEVVSRWLMACDVMALPFLDGLSARRGSFMNAVAHGVPVITTRPPVEGAVNVNAGEVGFVAAGDVAALAAALAEIRDCPLRRRQLTRGSQAIAIRHTWSQIARRTLDAYDRSA